MQTIFSTKQQFSLEELNKETADVLGQRYELNTFNTPLPPCIQPGADHSYGDDGQHHDQGDDQHCNNGQNHDNDNQHHDTDDRQNCNGQNQQQQYNQNNGCQNQQQSYSN